jgi:hypothetical protein
MGETINKLFLADCFDVPVIIIILCEYSPKWMLPPVLYVRLQWNDT